MAERAQEWCLAIGDLLFGWSLALPRDGTLLIVIACSVLVLVVTRRLCIPRDRLRDVRDDQRTLRRLLRTPTVDKQQRQRLKATRSRIALLRLRLELPSLAISFLPLLVLLTWAQQRITYLSPQPDREYQFVMEMPASMAGNVVHLVPHEAVDVPDGWLRKTTLRVTGEHPQSVATWRVTFSYPGMFPLQVRNDMQTWTQLVRVGENTYLSPRRQHDQELATQLYLDTYRPMNWWPQWPIWGMGAWFSAYMLGTVALYLAVCRGLRL